MAEQGDGFKRLEARATARADRLAGDIADKPKRTAAKVLACVLIFVVVCAATMGVISWVGSWGGEAARVTGVENVRAQHTAIIGDWQAMQAAAANACQVKAKAGEGDPTLIEAPDLAYAAKYRSIAADYNRRQANLFEGRLVGPAGYARVAPTLKVTQAEVC